MINTFETTEAATATEGNMLNTQIDAAVQKRIKWQNGTYAAANAELYNVLGDCLDLFNAVRRSYELPKGVNALLEERGLKSNASTSLELKIVRLVFAEKGTAEHIEQRLFSYARVIRAAADAKQSGATLAKFISDNNGIDEIRRTSKGGVKASDQLKAQVEQARNTLIEKSATALFENFKLPRALQPKDGEHYSLALVRKNSDGTGSIVFGTDNVAAVNSVLAIAGKTLKEERIKNFEKTAAHRAEAIRQANMTTLTEEMVAAFVPEASVTLVGSALN